MRYMNPIFMQLLIKAKKQLEEVKAKKTKTAMSCNTDPRFSFSASVIIELIILFLIIYIIESYGWFIW
jgi:hypothetical protein